MILWPINLTISVAAGLTILPVFNKEIEGRIQSLPIYHTGPAEEGFYEGAW